MTYIYRVGFTDVDWAQRLFGGDYYRWAEQALETWQGEAGLPWKQMFEEFDLGLPTIETRCHYLSSLYFEDTFEVRLGLRDLDKRGFVLDFQFLRADSEQLSAFGYSRRRFVSLSTGRPVVDIAAVPLSVYRTMAAETTIPTYHERRHQHAASKHNDGS